MIVGDSISMSAGVVADPLVSVVIPMYQSEAWIEETLTSALAQTYQNVEIVVVDDGSTDRGPDVVAEYVAPGSSRVQLVRTPNRGVGSARNTGVLASCGEYVALLDADDLWDSRKLEIQMAHLTGSGAPMCVCGYELFEDLTGKSRGVVQFRNGSKALKGWLALEGNGLLLPSTALIRRAVLEDMRGFDPEFSVSADLEFALRMGEIGPLDAVPETLVRYRVHPAQMHRQLSEFSADMSRLYDQVFTGGRYQSIERRCRANLDVHLGLSYLLRGCVGAAGPYLLNSLRRDPRRLITLPLRVLIRRIRRRFQAISRSHIPRWQQ
jgi:glycosyltransferase involved in cell wall biosynthesis|tara:strand:+ start:1995 stop:2963 length:969 start_codon:yes stop_codon:yes gene_type:complete